MHVTTHVSSSLLLRRLLVPLAEEAFVTCVKPVDAMHAYPCRFLDFNQRRQPSKEQSLRRIDGQVWQLVAWNDSSFSHLIERWLSSFGRLLIHFGLILLMFNAWSALLRLRCGENCDQSDSCRLIRDWKKAHFSSGKTDPHAMCFDAIEVPPLAALSPIARLNGWVVRVQRLVPLRLATKVDHPLSPNIVWRVDVESSPSKQQVCFEVASRSSADLDRQNRVWRLCRYGGSYRRLGRWQYQTDQMEGLEGWWLPGLSRSSEQGEKPEPMKRFWWNGSQP